MTVQVAIFDDSGLVSQFDSGTVGGWDVQAVKRVGVPSVINLTVSNDISSQAVDVLCGVEPRCAKAVVFVCGVPFTYGVLAGRLGNVFEFGSAMGHMLERVWSADIDAELTGRRAFLRVLAEGNRWQRIVEGVYEPEFDSGPVQLTASKWDSLQPTFSSLNDRGLRWVDHTDSVGSGMVRFGRLQSEVAVTLVEQDWEGPPIVVDVSGQVVDQVVVRGVAGSNVEGAYPPLVDGFFSRSDSSCIKKVVVVDSDSIATSGSAVREARRLWDRRQRTKVLSDTTGLQLTMSDSFKTKVADRWGFIVGNSVQVALPDGYGDATVEAVTVQGSEIGLGEVSVELGAFTGLGN